MKVMGKAILVFIVLFVLVVIILKAIVLRPAEEAGLKEVNVESGQRIPASGSKGSWPMFHG